MSATTQPSADSDAQQDANNSAVGNRLAVWVFLAFAFFYLLTSSGRVRTIDEVLPLFQAETFIHHGNFSVPQAVAGNLFIGKYDRFGRPEAPYPPAFALAITPAFVAGQFLSAHLPGIPSRSRDLVSDFFVTGSNAILAALAVMFAFLLLRSMGLGQRPALLVAMLIGLATPLFAYSASFFTEPLTAAVLFGAALSLFGVPTGAQISVPRAIAGGALLGAAVWIRPTHVVTIPIFLAAVVLRNGRVGRSAALIAGAAASLIVGAYLARNAALFGSPFDFGYARITEAGRRMNSFDTPFFTGFFGFILSPGKSVFLFAPPAMLAIWGLPRLWRLDRGLATIAATTPVAYLLLYSKFSQWEGNYCPGPRYLVPALSLLCLSLGPLLARPSRRAQRIAIFLGIAGFCVQLVSIATSFLEDQVAAGYYDAHLNYRWDYAPLISQTKLFFHYVLNPAAPLGRGFDRWFVFLSKAHVSTSLIAVILALECLGAFLAIAKLIRFFPKASTQGAKTQAQLRDAIRG